MPQIVPPSARLAPRAAAGLAGVALLTLTACGGGGEDPAAEESQTPEVPPAPEISEISDEMWQSLSSQESLTLELTEPATEQFVQQQFGVPMDGAGTITQTYSGAADGDGMTLTQEYDDLMTEYLTFSDVTYVTGEAEVAAADRQNPDVDVSAFEDELSGKHIDYGQFSVATIGDLIDQMQGITSQGDALDGLEGEAETRDGEGLWVYGDGSREMVVTAGEEPALISLAYGDEGERTELAISERGSAAVPERPAEEDVLSVDEVRAIVTG